jgi:hypothetical protein
MSGNVQPYRVQYNQDLDGDKVDYMPCQDPSTDRGALNVNAALASIAGCAATQAMALVLIIGSPTIPTIQTKLLAFQDNGKWSVTRTSAGVYVLKFYTEIYDIRNNLQTWNPLFADNKTSGLIAGGTLAGGSDTGGNYYTYTTSCTNYANTAQDPAQMLVMIW